MTYRIYHYNEDIKVISILFSKAIGLIGVKNRFPTTCFSQYKS